MDETSSAVLRDLAIILAVAGVATVVFQRLRLPIIAGYLFAGILVGPKIASGLITDPATIRQLAEVGVVLLLGSVGLEFRLRKLARLGPRVGLTAVIEVGFMLALGLALGRALGWNRLDSLLGAGIVAISSTMVVAKVFEERRPEPKVRDLVLGVLVMEDLVAIVLIAIASTAALGADLDARSIGSLLARLGVLLLIMVAAGLLLVPRVIRFVVRLGRAETTLVTAMGLCFTTALITHAAGYSVALGAFVAGLLIAESGVGHHVGEVIRPVRDLFAAVFFVAVGMLLDPISALEAWPLVLIVTITVVVGKILGVSVGAFLNGFGVLNSTRAGMSMAQIGEFSFILAGLGVASGGTGAGAPLYSIAVATAMITAFLTPWLAQRADLVANWVDRRLPAPLQTFSSLYGSWLESSKSPAPSKRSDSATGTRKLVRLLVIDTIAVAGALIFATLGFRQRLPLLSGLDLARSTEQAVALVVGFAIALPFGYGLTLTIRRLARLWAEAAVPPVPQGKVDQGLAPRRVFVITLEIGLVIAVGIPLVAVTLPFLPPFGAPGLVLALLILLGVAFWRTARDLDRHARAGAELVVHVLAKQAAAGDTGQFEVVRSLLPGLGDLAPFLVEAGSDVAGRTLGEINLRGRTGATLVALVRAGERKAFPKATERLEAGDLIAVTGTHDAVSRVGALVRAKGTTRPPIDRVSSAYRVDRVLRDLDEPASDK